MTTAIIDYDAGNLKSVEKALAYLGVPAVTTRNAQTILSADHIILPGVGAFGDAMEKLHAYGLTEVIREAVGKEIPFLGICLGLQLLFDSSEEAPGVPGLSILPGRILKFSEETTNRGLKIPEMGWNSLQVKPGARLFRGVTGEPYVYFVHSYYLKAAHAEDAAATAEYGVVFDASVEHGNLFACQFHPEKSGETGLQLLKNFTEL